MSMDLIFISEDWFNTKFWFWKFRDQLAPDRLRRLSFKSLSLSLTSWLVDIAFAYTPVASIATRLFGEKIDLILEVWGLLTFEYVEGECVDLLQLLCTVRIELSRDGLFYSSRWPKFHKFVVDCGIYDSIGANHCIAVPCLLRTMKWKWNVQIT